MTVGEYLSSLVFGIELPESVLTRAAYSPIEVDLDALELTDDAYPSEMTDDFKKRLDYASSTIYYAVLGVFSGGGYTEQIGDVRVSKNGQTITASDRERFKSLADNLRKKWNFDVEAGSEESGMFDITYLRH